VAARAHGTTVDAPCAFSLIVHAWRGPSCPSAWAAAIARRDRPGHGHGHADRARGL